MYAPVATPLRKTPTTRHAIRAAERVRRRRRAEHDVHRPADEHDVAHRPDPRPLPQRDPEEQHGGADDDRPRPDREADVRDSP